VTVDPIVTDPPYKRQFISLYGELARLAKEVLKPDGVLAVMCGQFLPAADFDGHVRASAIPMATDLLDARLGNCGLGKCRRKLAVQADLGLR
jgi:hypothetical protein